MSGSTCGLGAGPPSVEIPARPRTALLGNVRRYGHLLPVCEWFICRTVQHHFAQRSAYACPAILELTEGTSGEGDIPSVGRPLLVDGDLTCSVEASGGDRLETRGEGKSVG